jgi:hypothetical protein
VVEPPPWALGVGSAQGEIRLPLYSWPGGGRTTPKQNGVVGHSLWGGLATPTSVLFFVFFFLKKKLGFFFFFFLNDVALKNSGIMPRGAHV